MTDHSTVATQPASLLRKIGGFILALVVFFILNKILFLIIGLLVTLIASLSGFEVTHTAVSGKLEIIANVLAITLSIFAGYKTYKRITQGKKRPVPVDKA